MVCFSPSLGAGTVLHIGNFNKKVTDLEEAMNEVKGIELRNYQMSKANYVHVYKCGCFNRQINCENILQYKNIVAIWT